MAPGPLRPSEEPPGHRMLFPEVDLGCGDAAACCPHWGAVQGEAKPEQGRSSPEPRLGELLLLLIPRAPARGNPCGMLAKGSAAPSFPRIKCDTGVNSGAGAGWLKEMAGGRFWWGAHFTLLLSQPLPTGIPLHKNPHPPKHPCALPAL